MWFCVVCAFSFLSGTLKCSQEFSESVKYDVILKPSHLINTERQFHNLDLVSKYGQRFTCYLPIVNNETQQDYSPSLNGSYVQNLLSPLNQSRCIFLTKDWWTYELCYKKYISQFHREQGKKLSETVLGRFESETDWDNQANSTHETAKFHSQFYTNGTICDLTSKPRTTEVRYTCGSSTSFQIVSVEETETCKYLIIVQTSLLCAHPAFVAKAPTKVAEIVCAATTHTLSNETKVESTFEQRQFPNDNGGDIMTMNNSLKGQRRPFTLQNLYSRIHARRQKFYSHGVTMAIRHFNDAINLLEVDENLVSLHHSFVWKLFFQSLVSNRTAHYTFAEFMEAYELRVITKRLTDVLMGLMSSTRRLMDYKPNVFTVSTGSVKLLCDLGEELITALKTKINETSGYSFTTPYNLSHLQTALDSYEIIYTSLLSPTVRIMPSDLQKPTATPNEKQQKSERIVFSGRYREICPPETEQLRMLVNMFQGTLVGLKRIASSLLRMEQLQSAESELESTFRGLMHGGKFNVLLVRGAVPSKEKKVDRKASPPLPAEVEDQPDAESEAGDPVLALLHKVLKKVAPQMAKELEIYETHSFADGYSTFFIMANEEKAKEERRIQEQEEAYRFVQDAPEGN